MIIRIAIADDDVDYIQRLENVLEDYDDINLSIYTDKLKFEQAVVSKRFDVILLNPDSFQVAPELVQNSLTILMVSGSGAIDDHLLKFPKLKKYQRISRIYRQILDLYAVKCADTGRTLGQVRAQSIVFYSPVGGIGKTTLALASAARLALSGYRVFYLNLEDLPSEECFLPQNGEKGLSELVSLIGENINFSMKIQGLLQKKYDSLYYMNHFDSPNDIYEITDEEIRELIDKLENTGIFDAVIVDMSNSLDRRPAHIFEAAEKIIVVERNDVISKIKLNAFWRQTHIIGEYGSKMYRVQNFDIGAEAGTNTQTELIGRVKAVQNPDSGQLIEVLANDVSTNFILKLME